MKPLWKIEKRIVQIQGEIRYIENKKHDAVPPHLFNIDKEDEKRPLLIELEHLKTEREIKLGRRERLLWRIIWNVLTPIGVTVVTNFILRLPSLE